jgi:four helix bundle protein
MQKADIHDRIYRFVLRVLTFTKSISQSPQNAPIVNQLVRSATSVGANDQEADGAITRKDFIHCYVIAKKEAKETYYWLSIIADTNPNLKLRMKDLIQESKELTRIISSIIISAKKKV